MSCKIARNMINLIEHNKELLLCLVVNNAPVNLSNWNDEYRYKLLGVALITVLDKTKRPDVIALLIMPPYIEYDR